MEQGVLARLLEALEKTPPLSKTSTLAELVQNSKIPIEGQWNYPFHLVRHAAIGIIKSGIFVGDQLKGKKLSSSPPKFQTHPIQDPEKLVFFIAMPLVRDIENDISRGMCNFAKSVIEGCFSEIAVNLNRLSELPETWGMDYREINLEDLDFYQVAVKRLFSEIMLNINPLPGVIITWGSPKIKQGIDEIKTALDNLKEKLLANVPADYFRMENLINYLVNVLQRHVPASSKENIARRVADILKLSYNADVSYKTTAVR